jgi:TATA-binding protein-associated factor Taf7
MEIKEVLNYYLNKDNNLLEVSFRTIEDSEELVRVDNIDYSFVEEYGYELESESFDFFGVQEEDDEFINEEDLDLELDESELLNFLNEYYTVNPNSLPSSQPY